MSLKVKPVEPSLFLPAQFLYSPNAREQKHKRERETIYSNKKPLILLKSRRAINYVIIFVNVTTSVFPI